MLVAFRGYSCDWRLERKKKANVVIREKKTGRLPLKISTNRQIKYPPVWYPRPSFARLCNQFSEVDRLLDVRSRKMGFDVLASGVGAIVHQRLGVFSRGAQNTPKASGEARSI